MTLLDILPSLRGAMRPRIDTTIWPLTTQVDALGRLCVGSVALTDVADEFGTPAYVLDEADFRKRAQHYRATLRGVEVVYAAQSLLTRTVAGWVHEAGLGMAVCSTAELATALAGGMDPARIVVHGSGKSVDELATAAGAGVGRIVLDCPIEMAYLAGVARRRQAVLLQVRPGVDVLFLETGYHFAETVATRDALAAAAPVHIVDVLPKLTVVEQDAEYGEKLHDRNPTLCCQLRKVDPINETLAGYEAWVTGVG